MAEQTPDEGHVIMGLFIKEIRRRLEENPEELKAADFEMIRKVLADNSITLSSVRAGAFGPLAQKVAEEFPFPASNDEEAA